MSDGMVAASVFYAAGSTEAGGQEIVRLVFPGSLSAYRILPKD